MACLGKGADMQEERLGQILLETPFLSAGELERCLQIQALSPNHRPLGEILIAEGLISRETLERVLEVQEARRRKGRARKEGPLRPKADLAMEPSSLLSYARTLGATDLFLSLGRRPRFKVYGRVFPVGEAPVTRRDMETFLAGLTGEGVQALETLESENLACTTYFGADPAGGRFRALVFNSWTGPAVAVHLAPTKVPSFEELGHPPVVADLLHPGRGLILVVGPAGHGRSTTLAAMVAHICKENQVAAVVLDQSLEMDLPKGKGTILSRVVGRDVRSFPEAVRAAAREDADVIATREIPDKEAFLAALEAAEAGHLVLATLDAPTAAHTLELIFKAFPGPGGAEARRILATTLRAVLAQRLLPSRDGRGKVLALEILVNTPPVSEEILAGRTDQLGLLLQLEKESGSVGLDESLTELLIQGKISFEDAFEAAQDKGRLLKRLESLGAAGAGV